MRMRPSLAVRCLAWAAFLFLNFYTRAEIDSLPEVYIWPTVPETLEPAPNTRVSPGEFTITRIGNTNETLLLFVEFSGTATVGHDYQEIPQYLVMPAGESKLTILVAPLDDAAVEGDETVIATLSTNLLINSLPNYTVHPRLGSATVVIHDNDFPDDLPLVSIAGAEKVPESCPPNADCASISFVLRRTGPGLDRPLTVFVQYRGTATADVDYPALPGLITFEAGHDAASASAIPIDDTLFEGDETIIAEVIPLVDYYVDPNHWQATAILLDNEAPAPPVVSLELVQAEAMETRPDQNAIFWAEFRVLRTGPATNELVVFLNPRQGTARLGEDYWLDRVNDGSSLHFLPGQSSVNVRLYPIDDDFYEGDETAFVHLIAPPFANPLPSPYEIDLAHSAVAMIIHDNDPVTTRLDITSPRNGQQFEPGDLIELSAQIIGPGSSNSWSLDFFDGDQRLGTTRPDAPIWWGDASGGQHVITARASNSESTVLTSAPPVTIQVGPGAVLPVVKIGATPWQTGEPCPACFVAPSVLTIERTAPTNSALTVFLEIDGTATAGDDYQALPASVEIPAGQHSAQLTLLARDDQLVEGPEIVRVRVLRQPPPLEPPTYFVNVHAKESLVVIHDDEPGAPQARLDLIAPADGFHLRFPSSIEFSALAVYTQSEVYGPVEFYAGDQLIARSPVIATTRPPIPGLPSVHMAYWTNPPVGQYILTARTRLSLDLSITSPPVSVTVESPLEPVVRLETSPLQDPQALEFCPFNALCAYPDFVVRRTGPTNADLRVYLSYSGTASPGIDYPTLPDSVVIPAGRDAAFLRLVPTDDTLVEGPETVIARFTAVPGPGYIQDPNHASATITIIDNDSATDGTTVSIEALQSIAEEDSLPFDRLPLVGVFRISRTGPTNVQLPVFVLYSGTATLGEDYPHPPLLVTIPASAFSTTIQIVPNVDQVLEGIETVVARVVNCLPCPDPTNLPCTTPCIDFDIDPLHQSATVFIRDDGLTRASLLITSPRDGANFNVGETIPIEATAIDLDGYIGRVEFFDGDQRIGESEIVFIRAPDPGTRIVHSFEWQGASPGAHELTARAIAGSGMAISSRPVHITVGSISNQPPRVTIVYPMNGAEFPLNTPIELVAGASDSDGYVRKAEFFADGRKIGESRIEFILPPPPGQTQTFTFVWRFPTLGPHVLNVRATDNGGSVGASAPVEIRVTPPDLLPVVTVTAPDAFAVEPSSNTLANTALFRIRRFGPTNDSLAVAYSLHGTAQNDVDYEMLSGWAVLAPGQRTARVTVRALADALAEGVETVVLRLEEPAAGPTSDIRVPGYRVGFPGRAVVLISDKPWLHSPTDTRCFSLPDGFRHVCFGAQTGQHLRVEASSDLRNWETLCTTFAADEAVHHVDDEAQNFQSRFYRLSLEPVIEPED